MVRDESRNRRKLARIEEPTETTSNGKTSTSWGTYAQAWVSIEPLVGREYWEAERQDSSVTHKVTGVWTEFENVTADFRLTCSGRTFHLLEPPRNIDEANVVAEMMVEEIKG